MKGFELEGEGLSFGDQTKYGSIGVIGLGPIASSQLEKSNFLDSNDILTYNSYKNIDQKSVKDLCDTSDIIFLVINLDDISVAKSIWGLLSYLKSLDTNIIIIAKTSHVSLNLATTIKKYAPFLDLSKQENNDMLWTLKSLHRIIYYYNDEYNWEDAHYPPSMFWENFFETNSEIFLYQSDSLSKFIEKMEKNNEIREELNISKYCMLSYTNEADLIPFTLLQRLDEVLGMDSYLYKKNEKFDDLLLFVSI